MLCYHDCAVINLRKILKVWLGQSFNLARMSKGEVGALSRDQSLEGLVCFLRNLFEF